jgi:hypothetical protein
VTIRHSRGRWLCAIPLSGGRYMETDRARRNRACVDLAAAPEASRFQRWAGGVITLLLLLACWGAWVCLIGFHLCPISYLVWR